MAMWRNDGYDVHLIGPPIGAAGVQRTSAVKTGILGAVGGGAG